jgi:hypothetical protein
MTEVVSCFDYARREIAPIEPEISASPLFHSHQAAAAKARQQQQRITATTIPMIRGVFFFFGAASGIGVVSMGSFISHLLLD